MALPGLSLLQTSHSTSNPQVVVTSPSKPGQVQSPPSTPPPGAPEATWPLPYLAPILSSEDVLDVGVREGGS